MSRKVKTEDVPQEKPEVVIAKKPLNAIRRVRLANSLANVLENKQFVELVNSMDNGDYILEIFENAAEKEIEKIMSGDSVSDEEITEGSEKVEAIVNSCLRLQEQLVTLVRGRQINQQQAQQTQQQQRPTQQQRPQQAQQRTAPQQIQRAVMGNRKQPIYEEDPQQIYQEENFDIIGS